MPRLYTCWRPEHRFTLRADITGGEEPDLEKLKAYIAEKVELCLVPNQISFTEK